MNCPRCGGDTKVIDSRAQGLGVSRRRECKSCKLRVSTNEFLALPERVSVKKDNGSIEIYSPEKLRVSLRLVCLSKFFTNERERDDFVEYLIRKLEAEICKLGIGFIPTFLRIKASWIRDNILGVLITEKPDCALLYALNHSTPDERDIWEEALSEIKERLEQKDATILPHNRAG